jgi:hypothetical protein
MSEKVPYFCTKCNRNHIKGKIYEDHLQYELTDNEKKQIEKSKEDIVEGNVKPLDDFDEMLEEDIKKGPIKDDIKRLAYWMPKVEFEDGTMSQGRLEELLKEGNLKDLRLMIKNNKIYNKYKEVAIWRLEGWDMGKGKVRPFTIEETLLYSPFIADSKQENFSFVRKSKWKKAIKKLKKKDDENV